MIQNTSAIEPLRRFIHRFIALNDQDFELLLSKIDCQTIPRKKLLIEHGEVADRMFFLFEGFTRFFHWKDDGSEITSDFYFAPGFITSFTSFIEQKPSVVNIQAMVKMDVLVLKYNELQWLYSNYPIIERLGRLLTEQVFITFEKHLLSFLNNSPAERYQWLMKEYPEFIKNIPLQYLASYLGVTPESLSRIRKRIV